MCYCLLCLVFLAATLPDATNASIAAAGAAAGDAIAAGVDPETAAEAGAAAELAARTGNFNLRNTSAKI